MNSLKLYNVVVKGVLLTTSTSVKNQDVVIKNVYIGRNKVTEILNLETLNEIRNNILQKISNKA